MPLTESFSPSFTIWQWVTVTVALPDSRYRLAEPKKARNPPGDLADRAAEPICLRIDGGWLAICQIRSKHEKQ
jgi:hypothetical protein